MKIAPAPLITLSNGVEMPRLGRGTWPMNNAEAVIAVAAALDMGYRAIDTAENYENERGVGEGIRRASVKREDVFVTTKFNRKWHGFEGARKACLASLDRLWAFQLACPSWQPLRRHRPAASALCRRQASWPLPREQRLSQGTGSPGIAPGGSRG